MAKKKKVDDTDFEIAFYEGIIHKQPNFIEALGALGDLYTKKGDYHKGLVIDEKLAQLKPDDPIVLYNLACSYSLLKDIDKALDVIKQAVKCGYDEFEYLLEDEDLTNLQKDPRFKRYITRIQTQNKVPKKNNDS